MEKNLKELIKKVERLKKDHKDLCKKKMYGDFGLTDLEDLELESFDGELRGTRQTVEAIDKTIVVDDIGEHSCTHAKDWKKLKKVLQVKNEK